MLSSCSKENNGIEPKIFVEIGYQIFIEDADGHNLLDPNVVGSYKHGDIELTKDQTNGGKIKDNYLLEVDGKYFLDMWGGGTGKKESEVGEISYGTLYLKLSESIVDTIYSETILTKEGNTLLSKVEYNSKLVYTSGDSMFFTIIK